MLKATLNYLCKIEGWKTALLNMHWGANNMSQHKLCDEISDKLKDFNDEVAEVQQGIDGVHLNLNKLKPIPYKEINLLQFIEDVLKDTISFYKSLKGDDYIGLRSECEDFIKEFQKFKYLVKFTIKEERTFSLSESKKIIEESINILLKNKRGY